MSKERIISILRDIDRFFADLEETNVTGSKDLHRKEKFYAVSMILFSLVNRAIDLAEEVVSARNLGFPSTYQDIFSLLAKNGLIDEALHKDLSVLVHFRNLAAHEYHSFTEEDVYKAYKRISAVRRLVERVKKFLA